jgi:uncharacterized protein YceH (UPF0502 family)
MNNNDNLNTEKQIICPVCHTPITPDVRFCPSCGAKVMDPSMFETIDAYVKTKLDQEIARRFADQSTIAREIADNAEDTLWKRFRVLFWCALIVVAVLGFVGVKSFNDVTQGIVTATAGKVDEVKARITQLSKDLDAQRQRMDQRSGEISARFATLDKTASDAQTKIDGYINHADALSTQMDKRLVELNTKVAQVSTQVDNVSVAQTYPSLGMAKIPTYNGRPWDKDIKKPGDKWINIFIFPDAIGDFSSKEIETLIHDLRAAGYTPFLGMFGIGGPYSTGTASLGDDPTSAVNYFLKDTKQMAQDIRAIALRDLPNNAIGVVYTDAAKMDADDTR